MSAVHLPVTSAAAAINAKRPIRASKLKNRDFMLNEMFPFRKNVTARRGLPERNLQLFTMPH
jgi:hypothetical protein